MIKKRNSSKDWRIVYQLFKNYFEGNPTEKEREVVETWKAPTRHRRGFSKHSMEEDRKTTYAKLADRFGFPPETRPLRQKVHLLFPKMVVAASVLFFVGLGITFWVENTHPTFFAQQFDAKTVFEVGSDSLRVLTLADGSVVHLNRGSKLELVKNRYNRKQREVWLEGEAYFEVTKNPHKPFVVHSGKLQTTVKGTSFNIKAYPQLGELTVSVRTGKVEVGSGGVVLAMLTPDKQLVYHSISGKSFVHAIDTQELLVWTKGNMVLNNASAEELRLRLYQFYNVKVQLNAKFPTEPMFNASFNPDTPMEEVLQTICSIYNLQYSIDHSNNVTLFN
jgi:transmembrane sensor